VAPFGQDLPGVATPAGRSRTASVTENGGYAPSPAIGEQAGAIWPGRGGAEWRGEAPERAVAAPPRGAAAGDMSGAPAAEVTC